MSLWQVPAVVVALLAWLSAPPSSLGDVARREAIRRQLVAPVARVYSNEDLPAPPVDAPPPVVAPPAGAAGDDAPDKPPAAPPADAARAVPPAPTGDTKHDEAWWRDRITSARAALSRDQQLAEALQSHINGLTNDWINRDDPAQKAQLFEQRQQAIDGLDRQNKLIETDNKGIQAILDDAKKNNVPNGWIR
jgi:hypothetical protein